MATIPFATGLEDDDDENEDLGDDDGIGDVSEDEGVWVLTLRNERGRSFPERCTEDGLEVTRGIAGLENTGDWFLELGAVDDRIVVDVRAFAGGPTRDGVAPTDNRLDRSFAPLMAGFVDEAVVVVGVAERDVKGVAVLELCPLMDPERPRTLTVSLVGVDGAVAADLAVVGFEGVVVVRFTGSLALTS